LLKFYEVIIIYCRIDNIVKNKKSFQFLRTFVEVDPCEYYQWPIVFVHSEFEKDDSTQQNACFKNQFIELVETGEIFDACLHL